MYLSLVPSSVKILRHLGHDSLRCFIQRQSGQNGGVFNRHSQLPSTKASTTPDSLLFLTSQWLCVYLKGQVGDDAGDSEANQEQVGEDEGPGGVDDLLNPFLGATGLPRLPNG